VISRVPDERGRRSDNPALDPAQIERAARLLLDGQLVAFPTETVYGLGADADQRAAVATIFKAKGRPADHPLIVHVADAAAAAAWAAALSPTARTLMQRFWPGPLTLVVPRGPRAHDGLTGAQASVGLRCPSHPWARALLQALGRLAGDASRAIAAPSANRFGHISPTRAEHVRADLGEAPAGLVQLILDGGPCPLGIESTILDLTAGEPRLLRPGSVRAAQIEQVLGARLVAPAASDPTVPRASGRLVRHYAPRRPLQIVPAGALGQRIAELGAQRVAALAPPPAPVSLAAGRFWPAPADAPAYAQTLYDALHAMDASGAEVLLVQAPPQGDDWAAVHDRLQRSSAAGDDRFDDAD
jgi:L-threonylcarbamoyladenylate synthase